MTSGWLLVPEAYRCIATCDWDQVAALLTRAAEQGASHDDVDLTTIATVTPAAPWRGRGRSRRALPASTKAMLTITDGLTSPRATSAMYCACIGTCHEA